MFQCKRNHLYAAIFGCALIWASSASATQPEPREPDRFRVMSFNIHHGEGIDGKLDLNRIARLVKSERIDLLALQEVDKGTQRTQGRNLAAEIAALTGMAYVFSNNYSFQGGEYGNAILAKWPIRGATNLHYRAIGEGEPRGLLQVRLEFAGREVIFMNTHLDHRTASRERLLSATQIRSVLGGYGEAPIILCGDFNDTPGSGTHQLLSESLVDAWPLLGLDDGFTIPAQKPSTRIDYIWISKKAPFRPLSGTVPRTEASDHLPVVIEFEWQAVKQQSAPSK